MIRLVLIALSQLFANKRILENEVENVKDKATKFLKEIMHDVTTKACEKSIMFIVNSKSERQAEMQVRIFYLGFLYMYNAYVFSIGPEYLKLNVMIVLRNIGTLFAVK